MTAVFGGFRTKCYPTTEMQTEALYVIFPKCGVEVGEWK